MYPPHRMIHLSAMARRGSSSDRIVCVAQMHSRKWKVEHDESSSKNRV